jgi:hypothetical protein
MQGGTAALDLVQFQVTHSAILDTCVHWSGIPWSAAESA